VLPAVLPAALTPPGGLTARPASNTLTGACEPDPGIACRFVWDVSHSTYAADLTKVYFAGPAQVIARIVFVLLIAAILRIAAHRVIGKVTTRASENAAGRTDRSGSVFRERRNPRANALGSVLSNAATVTIFGIAAAIILGDMGVNLAPVLASAGVLGIAIGFGAQNLVQDFLAGIFMLLEDQFGVGDVIEVGDVTGTVEAVSLRITRLRDVNGVAWYIRNGTISQAGNESQGWARAVVDFPVLLRPRCRPGAGTDAGGDGDLVAGLLMAGCHSGGARGVGSTRAVQRGGGDAGDRQDQANAAVGGGQGTQGVPEACPGCRRRRRRAG
jgi:hypothetical protein